MSNIIISKECRELNSKEKVYNVLIAPENKIFGYSIANILKKIKVNFNLIITSPYPKDIYEFMTSCSKYDLWIISVSLLNKTCGFKVVADYIEETQETPPPIIFIGGNSKIYKQYEKFLKLYGNKTKSIYVLKPINSEKLKQEIIKLLNIKEHK